jgi:hypothetical protein
MPTIQVMSSMYTPGTPARCWLFWPRHCSAASTMVWQLLLASTANPPFLSSRTTSSLDSRSHRPSLPRTTPRSVSCRDTTVISGVDIIPIECPIRSPKDLVIISPGKFSYLRQTLGGPWKLPHSSGQRRLPRMASMRPPQSSTLLAS